MKACGMDPYVLDLFMYEGMWYENFTCTIKK